MFSVLPAYKSPLDLARSNEFMMPSLLTSFLWSQGSDGKDPVCYCLRLVDGLEMGLKPGEE